jgi:IS30 family transposase
MFVQTVQLAIEKGLVNCKVLSIDSVKIRANASSKKDTSIDGLNRLEDTIKEELTRFVYDVDRDERRDEEIEALRRQETRVAEANKELRRLVLHLLIITKNLLR